MLRRVKASFACGLVLAVGIAAPAWGGTTRRVSVGPGGVQGNESSFNEAISADGRFVAFVSFASNLVADDRNDSEDVFVHDRQTGRTERINLGPGGAEAPPFSTVSSSLGISSGGRFVAFGSDAANLIAGDTNGRSDIFVRDRATGRTQRVSLGPGGAQPNGNSLEVAISANGQFVAFDSVASNLVPGDTNGARDVFVRDRQTGRTQRVSVGQSRLQGNRESSKPVISADGRFVAFVSFASNLVPGDTNARVDVFVHDRATGRTERASLGPGGAQANDNSTGDSNETLALSADGRFVAFNSDATNLVPGDTNAREDVFVRDRATGRTERVSLGPDGAQASRCRSFSRCSAEQPSISADGRFVAFSSDAGNLVPGDTNGLVDVLVRDRRTGRTERASVGPGGVQGDSISLSPAISADGRVVSFDSFAANLVPADTGDFSDVFVRTR